MEGSATRECHDVITVTLAHRGYTWCVSIHVDLRIHARMHTGDNAAHAAKAETSAAKYDPWRVAEGTRSYELGATRAMSGMGITEFLLLEVPKLQVCVTQASRTQLSRRWLLRANVAHCACATTYSALRRISAPSSTPTCQTSGAPQRGTGDLLLTCRCLMNRA